MGWLALLSKTVIISQIITCFTVICKYEILDGIIVGDPLFDKQSFSENPDMENLVYSVLKKDKSTIAGLSTFQNEKQAPNLIKVLF
jgi:hypothetical protein